MKARQLLFSPGTRAYCIIAVQLESVSAQARIATASDLVVLVPLFNP